MFGLCVMMYVSIIRLQFAVENVVVEEEETVKKKRALLQGTIFGAHNEISAAHTKFTALRFTRRGLQFRAQL